MRSSVAAMAQSVPGVVLSDAGLEAVKTHVDSRLTDIIQVRCVGAMVPICSRRAEPPEFLRAGRPEIYASFDAHHAEHG